MTSIPRLVIAGASSGVGKTVLTAGLIGALRRRGLRVVAFKAGPDFIDPSYLSLAAGAPCHNLDSWMIPRSGLLECFHRATESTDIAVVEGMMGLFDGRGPLGDDGSTAQLARTLKAPVVLVVDASRASRSIAALVHGYRGFDRRLQFAGVIANRVASERHATWVTQAIDELSGAQCLGAPEQNGDLNVPTRHLGLVQAADLATARDVIQNATDIVEQQVDLDRIIEAAKSAPDLRPPRPHQIGLATGDVRIAVARDAAFSFYYQTNLDLLAERGAVIVPFSPISDASLPDDIAGLYIGGGYPELHLASLSNNQPMLDSIRRAAAAGLPVYGECGGLMYLSQNIRDVDGHQHPMVGLFNVDVRMEPRRTALGYASVTALRDTCILERGQTARGHEFRWSRLESELAASEPAYRVKKSDTSYTEGLVNGSAFGSYVHLHFASNPAIPRRFVEVCRRWRKMAMMSSR